MTWRRYQVSHPRHLGIAMPPTFTIHMPRREVKSSIYVVRRIRTKLGADRSRLVQPSTGEILSADI